MEAKLAKLEASQQRNTDEHSNTQTLPTEKTSQIGEQFVELRGMVERNATNFGGAPKASAKETGQAMNPQRDEIVCVLVGDTAELIAALALNKNVYVDTDESRYLLFTIAY